MKQRWWILAVLGLLIILFFVFDLDRFFSLDFLKASHAALQQAYQQEPLYIIGIYSIVYIVMAALSLPGATVMTLAGGAMFGLWVGVPVVLGWALPVGDVAAFAVTAVNHPAARNKAILIAGPAPYNWMEIVQTIGQVMGQSLPINYIPVGETVPLIPESMSPLMSAFETYEDSIEMRETAAVYGIEPTPLTAFAKRFFGVAA